MSRSKRSPSASDDQLEEPARKKSRFALNTSPTIITGSEAGTSNTTRPSTSSNESFFSSHEGINNIMSPGLGLTFKLLQHRTLTFEKQQLLQRGYECLVQVMQLMDRDQAVLTRKDDEHVAALGPSRMKNTRRLWASRMKITKYVHHTIYQIKNGQKIMKRHYWMLRFNTPSSNMPQEVEQL